MWSVYLQEVRRSRKDPTQDRPRNGPLFARTRAVRISAKKGTKMGKRFIRTHALLVGSAITFLLAGCIKSQPDYRPFGDGMKAIGICLVVCAAVKALAS